ncbi:hypothetical protein HC823_02400 [Candidatus Gracilibacteria bacterium]|nr:hypothetical protein [Candidatus Gracilibacteria bacterium]
MPVLYFAEWGVLPESRNSGVAFELFRSSMQKALEEAGDIPALGYTFEGGVAHRIFQGLGAAEMCRTEIEGKTF